MAIEIYMPKMGMTMEEGTIIEWFFKEGDEVQKGDVLLNVETDKAALEVEAEEAGKLLKIIIGAGETVPIKTTIGVIGKEGESIESFLNKAIPEPQEQIPVISAPAKATVEKTENIRVTPLARKIAKENNIDLASITPNPNGVIDEALVMAAISVPGTDYIEMTGKQKAAAQLLTKTWTTMPMVSSSVELDMTEFLKVSERLNLSEGVKITATDIFIKIIALVMERNRFAAVYLEDGKYKKLVNIDIGLAVAGKNGLVVPVIRDADKKNIKEINKDKLELIQKAAENKLSPDDFGGACTTLTNSGVFRTEIFTPIINYPESCIFGTGAILKKPFVLNDEIVIRPLMWFNFTYDHRVMDGAQASAIINETRDIIENPVILE